MPLYEVIITSAATVEHHYHIEAEEEEDAIAKARSGDHPCVDEQVYGEEERDVEATQIGKEVASE